MYYDSRLAFETGEELFLTPSVALRALHDQLRTYLSVLPSSRPDLFLHFDGPIVPPQANVVTAIGDSVATAISDYAIAVIRRFDALNDGELAEHAVLTREMFAMEHSLATDLGRTYAAQPLVERKTYARTTLAVAAFWTNRVSLIDLGRPVVNPILGLRPIDKIGAGLWEFAAASFQPLSQANKQSIAKLSTHRKVVDLTNVLTDY